MVFIDCISSMAGECREDSKECIFIENPASLEDMVMHVSTLLDKIESGEKFVIMDSLSTLLMYSSTNSVKKFSLFLVNKLRSDGVKGIFVFIEREVPGDLEKALSAMCDKVIYV